MCTSVRASTTQTTMQILTYLNQFEIRFNYLESFTGWSSEEYSGSKLEIYIDSTTSSCWYGYSIPGESHVFLYYNLSNQNVCNQQYYVNGNPQYGNPGELGDHWYYMTGPLHETTHAISPIPIFSRSWITEGFAQYNQYNVLAHFGDINQETADEYNHNGTPYWNWNGYVANDYRDTYRGETMKYSQAKVMTFQHGCIRCCVITII